VLPPREPAAPGLRERKKARTRASIQQHALRLFRERGYEATTVQQIAEAAEVSESTFFRYFPAKEDVVLWDPFDPLYAKLFREQPADLTMLHAIRAPFTDVLARLSPAERAEQRERVMLLLSVPPLRAMLVDQLNGPMRLIQQLVAERAGRRADDMAVRALAGAVIGVSLAAMFTAAEDPAADIVSLADEAMAQLEAGLPV
jgi:AcrR family transcriptional regulator